MLLADIVGAVSSADKTQIPKEVDERLATVVAQLVKQRTQKEKNLGFALTYNKLSFFAHFHLPFPYYFCMSIKEHLISLMLSLVSLSVYFMGLFLFVCISCCTL